MTPAPDDPMRVLLVNAPFGLVEYPHMGCSIIKPCVEAAGFPCDVLYATVEFASVIGFGSYHMLESAASPLLLPERLFAEALFPGVPSLDRFFDDLVLNFRATVSVYFTRGRGGPSGSVLERDHLHAVAADAVRYVEEVASRPELGRYRVIAFSSSFGQHVASLALAKRIKERHPRTIICFGGANCEGVMGKQLVRSFPFVDYAFSGDGDLSFPLFLRRLRDGKPIDVPGVYGRDAAFDLDGEVAPLSRANLDELPYPDFSDYFATCERVPGGTSFPRAIPIEGSRGCWWGEKHHCTFCGLNGQTMKHRPKSPQRFVDELEYLVTRYRMPRVMATDNILDAGYIRTALPMMKERKAHDAIFFEVKANLTREDLHAFQGAGITEIQPGIESLSSHVLKLVDKGTTGLQNVQLLKWGEEYGITLVWTVLCGIPGEVPEDYDEMGRLFAKIVHLQPPRGFNRVSVDRFAPYFKWPERYGITIHPAEAYRYIYDLPADEIANLAFWYYYDGPTGSTRFSLEAPPYAARALHYRTIWESLYTKVKFCYRVNAAGEVEIEDTRPVGLAEELRLDPLESAVFLLADRVTTALHVSRCLEDDPRFEGVPIERVRAILDDFERRFLVHREGDRYLALANRATGEMSLAQLVGDPRKGAWRRRQELKEAAAQRAGQDA